MNNQAKPSSGLSGVFWPMVLVCVVLMAGVLLRPRPQLATGQRLPPLMAEGWLNSQGPPLVEGKVVVVDAWFTRCGPCLQSLPRMAELHRKWARDERVVFVGLTFEPGGMLPDIQRVMGRVDGFDWPVGYGASPTLDLLGVEMYPTLILFDKSGVSVWTGHSVAELDNQLEALL
ncbi:MAG: TlpA family protein disulfide reductase [Planctomycetales bacterium]|nr:TlpA family protein disulfide reductase [Planctomycetales bacterium]